jgi:hypothetical protein
MDIIRREILENILTATPSQQVVGYIHKFLFICTVQEKRMPPLSDVTLRIKQMLTASAAYST